MGGDRSRLGRSPTNPRENYSKIRWATGPTRRCLGASDLRREGRSYGLCENVLFTRGQIILNRPRPIDPHILNLRIIGLFLGIFFTMRLPGLLLGGLAGEPMGIPDFRILYCSFTINSVALNTHTWFAQNWGSVALTGLCQLRRVSAPRGNRGRRAPTLRNTKSAILSRPRAPPCRSTARAFGMDAARGRLSPSPPIAIKKADSMTICNNFILLRHGGSGRQNWGFR